MSSAESSVYIITSKDNSKIKIGKANNVFQRISAFSYIIIDYDRSLEIICRDEKAAKKIETMLHARFDDYRINSLEIGRFDGSTEWFSYDIIDLIEPFIIHSGDDRVVQIRNGIQIPQKSESVKKRQYYSQAERELMRKKKWFAEDDIKNVEKINNQLGIIQRLTTLDANSKLYYSIKNTSNNDLYLYIEMTNINYETIKELSVELTKNFLYTLDGTCSLCNPSLESNSDSANQKLRISVMHCADYFPSNSKTVLELEKFKQSLFSIFSLFPTS